MDWRQFQDPFKLSKLLWPKSKIYDRQEEIIRSVWHNDKTICVAGNKLGKDYITARICILFALTRYPFRIVTTSVDSTQLESVLWGEIGDAIQKSAIPLTHDKGGPFVFNHMHIRKVFTSGPNKGEMCKLSYILGRVAKKGEGFLGHHIGPTGDGIPRTLFIVDEASSAEDDALTKVETWADRQLYIGNAFECNNIFKRESEAGDVRSLDEEKYYTKVIRITGHDSPNVRYAKAYKRVYGEYPKNLLIPGVLPIWQYNKWVETWDEIRKSVCIDAQFYKGSELLLYPPAWLDHAHKVHKEVRQKIKNRRARAMGVDPGEGVAETVWCIVDEYGILEMFAKQTPNTADISKITLRLMKKWNLPPHKVMFDLGGGGHQIADHMRDAGHYVQTVGFGEKVVPPPKHGVTTLRHQVENREERYTYLNRRAQMYGRLSELLDPGLPAENGLGFGIPDTELELRRQLAPIPKTYDKEGQLYILPKNKGPNKDSKQKTLTEIIGCSPDRADALIIAIHCRDYAPKKVSAGVA